MLAATNYQNRSAILKRTGPKFPFLQSYKLWRFTSLFTLEGSVMRTNSKVRSQPFETIEPLLLELGTLDFRRAKSQTAQSLNCPRPRAGTPFQEHPSTGK